MATLGMGALVAAGLSTTSAFAAPQTAAIPAAAQNPSQSQIATCGADDVSSTDLTRPQVRTTTIDFHTGGSDTVRVAKVGDQAVLQGDICLGSLDERDTTMSVVTTGRPWTGGVIPYVNNGADASVVQAAVNHWNTRTPVRVVPRTNQTNYVEFYRGGGCSSAVGMVGGRQRISLANGCGTGAAIHEIGHAAGLWHEQSRNDRDQHVEIRYQNIQPGLEYNFDKVGSRGRDVGAYDYGSIMHYSSTAFSRNGQPTIVPLRGGTIGQRSVLSPIDLEGIRALYGGTPPPNPGPPPPPPNPGPPPPPPPPGSGALVNGGIYTFTSAASQLNASGGSSTIVQTRETGDNARFRATATGGGYTLTSLSTGRCIDVRGGSTSDLAQLVQSSCRGGASQRWTARASGSGTLNLIAGHSNKCMDVPASTRTAGTTLIQYTCHGGANQQWRATRVG